MLIDRTSLSQTVDAISAAHVAGRTLTADERGEVARWIAGRQGLPGAYADTFAGFPSERSKGIVLFTGERITSASARHILGEEASRALRQLRVRDPNVTRALERADSGLMSASSAQRKTRETGILVCSAAASAVWGFGGICSQADWIARKNGCSAVRRICVRCTTANISGASSLSGTPCWP